MWSFARFRLVKALGNFSAALLVGVLSMQTSYAGPEGGRVVRGDGDIVRPNATTTDINQNSRLIVIDWNTFNVGRDETVNFHQPSADAAALNRIFDQNPSEIFGTLNANGRVLLVNPNGLLFGQSASVNVGSLIASGMDIDADAFMEGDWTFANEDGSGGLVVNHGLLQAARGGSINLFGGAVENTGTILADFGTINLAAGEQVTIDFDGDGLIQFAVDGEIVDNAYGTDAAVSNSGILQAESGQILLSATAANDVFAKVVNNTGVVDASGVAHDGGRVFLTGSGGDVINPGTVDAGSASGNGGFVQMESDAATIVDGGTIDVSSDSANGGKVRLLGDRVGMFGHATVDASGADGGGEVLVGGDYQGSNAGIRNASQAVVGSDAVIAADADVNGDGGRVIVWSDNNTRYYGSITARGGAVDGDGGFVEVSGREQLAFSGTVDTSALHGMAGTLLLDPTDIVIDNGGSDELDQSGGDPNTFSDSDDGGPSPSHLDVDTLIAALGTGNVIVTTASASGDAGTITLASTLSYSSANSLTLLADSDISVSSIITNTGTGALTLDAGGDVHIDADITLSGGDFTASGVNFDSTGFAVSAAGVTLTLNDSVSVGQITGGGADTVAITVDADNNGASSLTLTGAVSGGTINYAGNGTDDTLVGANQVNSWAVTSANGGTLNGGVFTDFANLTGNASTDNFSLAGGTLSGTVTGGSGTDTLTADNVANTWNVTAVNAGDVTGVNAFTSIENLNGGSGTDNFVLADGVTISGTVDGNGGTDTLDLSAYTMATDVALTATGGNDGFNGTQAAMSGFANIDAITGSTTATNTFTGLDAAASWTITGVDGGSYVSTNTLAFTGFQNTEGGSGADAFTLSGGSITGTITGGSGNDTLTADDVANTWNITAANAGDVTGVNAFTAIENVAGGTSTDSFVFGGGSVSGSVDGGGDTDTFDYSTATGPVSVNLASGTATNVDGTFSNIEAAVGSSDGGDTLTGANDVNAWSISGSDSGDVDGFTFSSFENLAGGSSGDTFSFLVGGSVTGDIDGGGGTDTLDYSTQVGAVSVDLSTSTATSIGGTFANIDGVTGGAGTDTLTGADDANAWNLAAADGGDVDGFTFSAIENLTGGTSDDDFIFGVSGSLSGQLDGGAHTAADSVDYSALGAISISTTGDFVNIESVVMGTGSTLSGGTDWTLTAPGGGTVDGLAFSGVENISGTAGDDSFTLNGGSLPGVIDGVGGNDTLTADNTANTWAITGTNAGDVTGVGSFTDIENLVGNAAGDTFSMADTGMVAGSIDGAGGTNELTGGTGDDTFNITGTDAGTLTNGSGTTTFTGIDDLTGGAGDDDFTFGASGSLSGQIDGGAHTTGDAVDYSALGGIVVTLGSGATNVEHLTGATSATLAGGSNWLISGANTGTVDGHSFDGFGNVEGTSGDDTFDVNAGGSLTGTLAALNGSDTLQGTGIVDVALNAATLAGFDGTTTPVSGDFSGINIIDASGSGTLTGANSASTWNITGADAGSYDVGTNTLAFTGFGSLAGGNSDDTFVIGSTGTLSGSITAGAATTSDTLAQSDGANNWGITGTGTGTVTDITGTFSGIESVSGGTGVDTFDFSADATISVTGGAGNDVFNLDQAIIGTLDGGDGDDTFNALGGTFSGGITGGEGVEVNGDVVVGSGPITIVAADSISTNAQTFADVENLVGSAGADTITIASGGSLGGDIDGMGGSDVLQQADGTNTWTVTGTGTGSVTDIAGAFAGIESIFGGSGPDTFNVAGAATMTIAGGAGADVFDLDALLAGSIDGETGSDTLQGSQVVDVMLTGSDGDGFAGTNAGVSGGFDGIDSILGTGTLTATDTANTWSLDGTPTFNDGSSSSLAIGGFATLQGGSAADMFSVSATSAFDLLGGAGADTFDVGATVSGNIDGEGGSDTLQGTLIADATLAGSDTDGFAGTTTNVTGNFDGIDVLIGAGTLTGSNTTNTWTLDGTPTFNDGSHLLTISGFATLQGGTSNDTFDVTLASAFDLLGGTGDDTFGIDATLTGRIDGEAGIDTLQGTQIANVTLSSSDTSGVAGTTLHVSGGFDGIDTLTGSGTLTGSNTTSTWTLDGTPTFSDGSTTLVIGGFTDLQGGSAADTFNVSAASAFNLFGGAGADTFSIDATLSGNVDGETGSDTLQGTQIADVTLTGSGANGFAGTTASVTGGFDGIDTVNGTGTLIGTNTVNTWSLDGTPTFSNGSHVLNIGGFASLQGGTSTDAFNVTSASAFDLSGGAGADTFNIGATLAGTLDGESGSDTLNGADDGNTWTVNSDNAGTVDGVAFANVENLNGGNGADQFELAAGVSGTISGGAGTDGIDILASFAAPATELTLDAETISNSGGGTISVGTLNLLADNVGSGGAPLITNVTNLSLDVTADAFVTEANAVSVAGDVGGDLALNAAGNIAQSAPLIVTGTASLASTGGNITLGHDANDFGLVTVSQAGHLSIDDANGIGLGAISVSGSIDVASLAGGITVSGSIVSGAAGWISLDASGTLLIGATVAGGSGGVSLDAANTTINQAITSSGGFSQSGGVANVGADITTNGNVDFAGAVTLTGDVDIDTTTAQSVRFRGPLSGGGNDLLVDAGGTSGTLRLDGAASNIGVLTVAAGTAADLNADLAARAMQFSGSVDLASNVDMTSSSALAVAGTVNLSGSGTSVIESQGDAAMSLGAITASANQSLVLVSQGNLAVDNVALNGGDLSATIDSDGDSSASVLSAASLTGASVTLSGGADGDDVINVDSATSSHGNVTIASDISLANTFNVTSAAGVELIGDIYGDSGAGLNVDNKDALVIAGDIVLDDGALVVDGELSVTGFRTVSTGSGAMSLGVVNGDSLVLSGSGLLTLSGDMHVDSLDTSGMSGRMSVNGDVAVRTPGSDIDLRSFNSIDAGSSGGSLLIDAAAGEVFVANIGASTALGALTVNGSEIHVSDALTSGGQEFNGTLFANGELTAGGAMTVNGDVRVDSEAVLGGATTLIAGNIDGEGRMTLISANDVVVGGDVGSNGALEQFEIVAESARVNDVTTSGRQAYDADMRLSGDLAGARIEFRREVLVPEDVVIEADAINFNGNAGSVSGSAQLTLLPATDGLDVQLGGAGDGLALNNEALDGYGGDLVVGGLLHEDGSVTTRAGTIVTDGSLDVGESGTLTLISRDGIALGAGTISGGTLTLVAGTQAGTIRNVANRAADSLLAADSIILVAGGQIGDPTGNDINVVSRSGQGTLEVASGITDVRVNNIGNTMLEVANPITARAISNGLELIITDGNIISSSAQNSANKEQSAGLADEGFIDPSLFEDIALYEVSDSGIALPADQSEEATFDGGPVLECDSETEECSVEAPAPVGAVSPR